MDVGGEPGASSGALDPAVDGVAVQRTVRAREQSAGGERSVAGLVVRDQLDEVRVEWDVAVVVEFADGDPQPGLVLHDRDGVGLEVAELADTHPSPGQQFDSEPAEQGRLISESAHELGELTVVEELRQALVAFGDVTEEDRHSCWGVVPVPLDDADEEHSQAADPPSERCRLERAAGVAGLGVLPDLECLDIGSVDVSHAAQCRVVVDEEPGKDPQIGVDRGDRRGPERHRDLGEVGEHRDRQLRNRRVDLVPVRRNPRAVAAVEFDGDGTHLATASWSASIRLLALRYSPASHSFVRCRYTRVVSIEA